MIRGHSLLGRLRAVIVLALPSAIARPVANLLGFRIARGARIGFSWLTIDELVMAEGARIGHFNRLSGPFAVDLANRAAIGNFNLATRGVFFRHSPRAELILGQGSKITSRHRLDLTCSIRLGDYSTIAGNSSQLWTHGYVHEAGGGGRYRVDGEIEFGDSVYVGSMCLVSLGVRVASDVIIGAGAVVAKDLAEPGLYVSAALRQLPRPATPAEDDRQAPTPGDRGRSYRRRRG